MMVRKLPMREPKFYQADHPDWPPRGYRWKVYRPDSHGNPQPDHRAGDKITMLGLALAILMGISGLIYIFNNPNGSGATETRTWHQDSFNR